jgi:hypothetical protein
MISEKTIQTENLNETSKRLVSPILRWVASGISYIFHPLFIPTYVFLFLMKAFPYEFADITDWQLQMRLFGVFWLTAFFPAFSVFLLWRLKFSDSIFLRTQKERIVPYVISMFFYWWMYYLSRNFHDQPIVLRFFFMGIFIATVFGLILNNYFKISLHGMGVGGATTAIILFSIYYHLNFGGVISVCILLSGLVCSSRFLVSDHTNKEIYTGLAVGIGCQLLAYWFIL